MQQIIGRLASSTEGRSVPYNDEVLRDPVVTSTYVRGEAFARSRPRARAVHRPFRRGGGRGRDGPAGDGPRAMPLRVAPGAGSGPRRL
jgi:hypothetical protein